MRRSVVGTGVNFLVSGVAQGALGNDLRSSTVCDAPVVWRGTLDAGLIGAMTAATPKAMAAVAPRAVALFMWKWVRHPAPSR